MRIQVKPKPLRLPEPNPVLVKEVRSRFRGPRGFAALTSFLILLTAFAYLLYRMQIGNMSRSAYYGGYGPGGPANVYAGAAAEIGQAVFATVAVLEMLFMAFIAPALTMNAISSEVERQTYELLLATPLSAWAILRGKVGAALGYVLLLIFSALPVISLAFLFGGVPAVAVAQVQLSVFVSGLLFLTIGLFYSSLFKRTSRSAIMAYVTVAVLTVLPVLLLWVAAKAFRPDFDPGPAAVNLTVQTSPFAGMVAVVFGGSMMGGGGSDINLFWAQTIYVHVMLAGVFYLLAGSRIRRVGRGAVIALLALVGLLWAWAAWVISAPPFA